MRLRDVPHRAILHWRAAKDLHAHQAQALGRFEWALFEMAEAALELRLRLRAIFDQLDHDGDGGVSVGELQRAMRCNNEIARFFASSGSADEGIHLFRRLDRDGNGVISWEEFMAYVASVEAEEDLRVSLPPIPGAPGASDLSAIDVDLSVQRMAVEVTLGRTPRLHVVDAATPSRPATGTAPARECFVVDADTVIATRTAEIKAAIAEALAQCGAAADAIDEPLARAVSTAVTHARRREARLLRVVTTELEAAVDAMAEVILDAEDAAFDVSPPARHDASPPEEAELVMTAEEEAYLAKKAASTPSELAQDLAALHAKVAKKKAELQAGRSAFLDADRDGDGVLSRDEWRSWADEKMGLMRQANAQREHLIIENRRLRRALLPQSAEEIEVALREIDNERKQLRREVSVSVSEIEEELF